MLKSIVKHEDFTAEILDCPLTGGESIPIRNDGSDSDEVPGQQIRLVTRLPVSSQHLISV
jgi:hypothetical protein